MARARLVAALATATLLVAAPLACSGDRADPVPRRTLVAQIEQQLSTYDGLDDLRAVLVHVDGRPVLEKYYEESADTYWDVGTVTTTVVSTLVGIAIGEGAIGGLDQTLATLLPRHRSDMSPAVARTTLFELMTMTAGFPGTDRDRTPYLARGPDPVGRMLQAASRSTRHGFELSHQGAHVLAAVLAEAVGEPVLDYARSRLLDPLAIDTTPGSGFAWPVDRDGLHQGWSGLRLRPRDLVALGELLLDRGRREGRQLVPESWVGRATTEQVRSVTNGQVAPWFGLGWWVSEMDGLPAHLAWGEGGQLVEVVPDRGLVVVVVCDTDRAVPGSTTVGFGSAALSFLVEDVIAPAVAP